jgi:hypothetical protein
VTFKPRDAVDRTEVRPVRYEPTTREATNRKLRLRVDDLTTLDIRGEAGDRPRAIPLSEVHSISYVTGSGGSAGKGAGVGLLLGGLIGFAGASAGTQGCKGELGACCGLGVLAGALTGVLIGTVSGAIIGDRVRILVQPPPAAAAH